MTTEATERWNGRGEKKKNEEKYYPAWTVSKENPVD